MIGHMSEHLCLPVSKIINWPLDLFIGVPIFFILSGFLIWNSLENTLDFKQIFFKEDSSFVSRVMGLFDRRDIE